MSTTALDWTEANQQFMSAELAWLRQCLDADGAVSDDGRAAIAAAVDRLPSPSAIDTLAELFDLSMFERRLLLLCAGVEMDGQLAASCARLHGDDGRRYVTFSLALAALPGAHWSALTPVGPLRRWRLIDVEPGPRLVDGALRIDERILHFLAGINLLDPRLRPLLTMRDAPALMAPAHTGLAGQLSGAWSAGGGVLPVIHLSGDDGPGQEDVGAAAAAGMGLRLLVLKQDDLPPSSADLAALLTLCEREARLLPAALLVRCADAPPTPTLIAMAERATMPLLVSAREPLRLRRAVSSHDVNKPAAVEQKSLWLDALGEPGLRLNGSLDAIAAQFRLSASSIAAIAASVTTDNIASGSIDRRLWQACRVGGRRRLDDLAERIAPAASWDDLVLPDAPLATLRQIAAHVRQRARVHDEWGFAEHGLRSGIGVSALFCGESGTGKSLAAEVLAHELGLDLYRIDLSCVVSKYIGETEKNLRRVFDAAEDSGSILLFDEADALFGKRSEVKDSHDRYANIEISYLLQRMEAYRGLAVLTTNMKRSLDRAFQRRLRFIITFPFPDSDHREEIWRRVFPPATPLRDIDYRTLARLNLPGGHIRNIALSAAFLAADSGAPVGMEQLLAAAHAESAKLERPLSEAEMRGWS
jgi:hypothetical protein